MRQHNEQSQQDQDKTGPVIETWCDCVDSTSTPGLHHHHDCPFHQPPTGDLPICPECGCSMWPQPSTTVPLFACEEPACVNGPGIVAKNAALLRLRHPESYCHQCLGPNIVWSAPNHVWNRVMPNDGGIICPICFVQAAEAAGISTVWRLTPEGK